MSEDLSIEHKLAQAMIELRKGREPISSLLLRKDLLNREFKKLEEELIFVREENKFLDGFKKCAELVMRKNGDINDNDIIYLLKEIDCEKKLEDAATQACCSRSLTSSSRSKERLINNLLIKENLLKAKLNSVKAETNHTGPDYILVKRSEYLDLLSKVEAVPKLYKPFDSRASIQTSNSDLTVSSINFSSVSSNSHVTECTSNGDDNSYVKMEINNENNGFSSFPEESDEEGARLLLSMKQNCWSCKCGEYFNNITEWSEHKKICNPTGEKSREQCQLCKKTFVTCVALNIHSTKKHNKKRIRTDSILKCPCGQTFKARWRQNCVHKLNTHGRHCKAFKKIEMRCDVCKKGFICRKSLEFHGLKAHKLPVPVNSE